MILTAKKIAEEYRAGAIEITPYHEDQLNPNSYDLRLGDRLLMYKPSTLWDKILHMFGLWSLDPRKKNDVEIIDLPSEGYTLKPGVLYLGATEERVGTDLYTSIVDGKSSLGRLGLFIHVTAGYVDTGFHGNVTLELVATQRVKIYPGMRIGQIRYQRNEGEITLYCGNYENSTGPLASRSWNQK